MIEILGLSPEDEQRLDSHALKRLSDWRDRILHEAPQLRGLSTQQIKAYLRAYLRNEELAELSKCLADVTQWLSECMDTGDTYSPRAYAQWVFTPMFRVESLLATACRRADAEQRRKEYDRRWRDAFVAIKPPTDSAEKYLDGREQDEFVLSLDRAIKAYMDKGPAYLNDIRAMNYVGWLERIQERAKEEASKQQAVDMADEYNHRLNQEIADLTSQLDDKVKDLASYFRTRSRDRRYTNQAFRFVISEEQQVSLDRGLVSAANSRLERLLSDDLRCFVPLPRQYYRRYFALPKADYRLDKVPCIDMSFDVFTVGYAEVWLRGGKRSFNGYEFDLPWIEGSSGFAALEEPMFLGYYHLILEPEELGGCVYWNSIPLTLLKGLLSGETRPGGCTISAASDSAITYAVQGFGREISIPDQLIRYLTSIGSVEEMVRMGIMTEKVCSIVSAALSEFETGSEVQPTGEQTERTGSMKERAFELFDCGRRPSDPEVRALDIKPNSAYRYFQTWKKARRHGQSRCDLTKES